MHIEALYRYPVKSLAGEAVDQLQIAPRGPVGDRRYMVVDADGQFMTARTTPEMLKITPRLVEGGLHLTTPGQDLLRLIEPDGSERRDVTVWKDTVSAIPVDGASEWLSDALGTPCDLVFMDADSDRPIAAKHNRPGADVSFADAFPLLMINRASLEDLSGRVGEELDVRRFRPNIVLAGADAWAEDNWTELELDGVRFDIHSPCARCKLTTIDPDSCEAHKAQEPLSTLAQFRRKEGGVMFGVNCLLVGGAGTISVAPDR